jgi:predicted RNase H-like HicB family nuclease
MRRSRSTLHFQQPSLTLALGRKCAVDLRNLETHSCTMRGEFNAIIEEAPEGGYWAICPEVAGANGQGETVEEAKENLREAIRLILEDRLEDVRRGLPADAIQTVVIV